MFLIAFFIVFLFDCTTATAQELTAKAIYLPNVIQTQKAIHTCWVNPEADRIILKESALKITEDIIKKEYARAGIEVSGWKACNPVTDAVDITKIFINDQRPMVIDIGCVDKNLPWCIRLNFEFLKWPGLDTTCKTLGWDVAWACNCHQDDFAKPCIQNYAIHEFGHSLGLAHEADHSQSTCPDQTGTVGAAEPFPYNPLSIMNYCRNKDQVLFKMTPELSVLDIQTILLLPTFNTRSSLK